MPAAPYYRRDLARVHHLGFAGHADNCAPGILSLLEPVRGGLVLELGCGSGLLTGHLAGAGHRVLATDASPAMLELAREWLPADVELARLTLPDDPIPAADAIVSIGHALSYLDDEDQLRRGLGRIADALRPGGVLAVDICDLRWGESRRGSPNFGRFADDWAIVTEYSLPRPDRFVRRMAIFTRDGATWHRDDECHENVLVDTTTLPPLLAAHAVRATLGTSFGDEELPDGLMTLIGRRD